MYRLNTFSLIFVNILNIISIEQKHITVNINTNFPYIGSLILTDEFLECQATFQ